VDDNAQAASRISAAPFLAWLRIADEGGSEEEINVAY
jgi:hypothetical protein